MMLDTIRSYVQMSCTHDNNQYLYIAVTKSRMTETRQQISILKYALLGVSGTVLLLPTEHVTT